MPLTLNALEKIGINRLNKGPAPMIDLLGMLSFKAVATALKLGIFDCLGTEAKNAGDMASVINVDQRGLILLLDALVHLGYLKLKRGYYRNTACTRKWLLSGSPYSIAALFHQFNDMSLRWDYLDRSIQIGKPHIPGWQWLDRHPECWNAYHAGLQCSAVLVAQELLKKVTLPSGAARVIDIGGSHGQYCIELCLRYQNLSCIVYDWEPAEKTAVDNIESFGLSDRITFKAGDFISDPIGNGYDVMLVFNVIRIFKPGELVVLLRKFHESLAPQGMIIIMDHLGHVPSSQLMKTNAALLKLELYNSTEGTFHNRSDVRRWLEESGFSAIRDFCIKRTPGLGVITAVKK
ncbi:MAG: methyltransferase domain-containing protein [Spirochaetes bacterium]|nr:methyltransferase domain-containing protein [Spirochaetota bacterium]